jgi:dihydrofolate reductase
VLLGDGRRFFGPLDTGPVELERTGLAGYDGVVDLTFRVVRKRPSYGPKGASMGKVILDMAMSLDGFVCGQNDEDGGLHNYFFSPSEAIAGVVQEGIQSTGTIIMGRGAYEAGARQGGFADSPYQVPTFVLSSEIPQTVARGAEAFVFVTDGSESALRQAQAAAGDRDVVIGGGAVTAQGYLRAGRVDEIHIYLAPVLLGNGRRLFENLGAGPVALERLQVIGAPEVTYLRFRVVR